jgi:predicted RNA-binding Zn ribbon-like protein
VTGQVQLDRYADAGVLAAIELVNVLAGRGSTEAPAHERLSAIARALAEDPASVAQLDESHVPAFTAMAHQLREVFDALHAGDLDSGAQRVNRLLADHPAHPHLAKEGGEWRLHHHPVDATLAPMWTSICAEAMARTIGLGHGHRLGTCDDPDCGRVFLDVSKNASRRFCSTTCQNRIKTAAYRRRQLVAGTHG